jgi:hypothetical protein
MSLIPSESLNFPDHFRATIKPGSPKERTSLLPRPQPKPLPQTAPPQPRPLSQTAPPQPRPLPPTVPVEPPKIPVVPRAKVRFSKPQPIEGSNNVGAGHQDSQPSLRYSRGQKIATSTAANSGEAATVGTASPAASQAEPAGVSHVRREGRSMSGHHHATARRRNNLFRFVLCEGVAISILLPLVMLGISGRFTDQTLILLIRILIVSAVAAVVIFPMIFFRRWENSRARQR